MLNNPTLPTKKVATSPELGASVEFKKIHLVSSRR